MKKTFVALTLLAASAATLPAFAQPTLLAKGTLISSRAGSYADLSGLKGTLENGAPANLLGGFGSGIAHISGDQFVAVPDRGPNAVPFNSNVDDTVSYINRVHTIKMNLKANKDAGLPYTIDPELEATTLLFNLIPLSYGSGIGLGVGDGAPKQNNFFQHFFTGRSDNFNSNRNSGDPSDARLDPESIRVSNDGLTVFISDEYGPYVYQFLRCDRPPYSHLPASRKILRQHSTLRWAQLKSPTTPAAESRTKAWKASPSLPTAAPSSASCRTRSFRTPAGGAPNLLRIVTIDIASGRTTHEYPYLLTTGSGVSDIVALNNHEFLVDERDGKGLADASKAKIKQIFKIDLEGATDISNMTG